MHIQIININNLKFTKQLTKDLLNQTEKYRLTIIDQNSKQKGTKKYFKSLKRHPHINTFINNSHIDLNRLWNAFYLNSSDSFLCFLNNDVRVPSNFVEDTTQILNKNRYVGCVVHATNHPDYKKTTSLKYIVTNDEIVQGWDFTIRRQAYTFIPECLKTFGGDDWLFAKLYENNWKTAIALSSPIIHYHAKSRKYFTGDRKEETKNLKKLGIKRRSYYYKKYSRKKPSFFKITENDHTQKS